MIVTLYTRRIELVGFIPSFINESEPRPAREQFDANYRHGGGWRPFDGFKMNKDHSLKYPGDPALKPMARMSLRHEVIFIYEWGWVAVVQPDGSFEVCRMD